MDPQVSIALPVYNGEKFIEFTIKSVLDQDYNDLELIITDNRSTDRTKEICLDLAETDPRIRYVENPRNLGAAPNYNAGYALARGKYLKWSAHDDLISPNFISATVSALETHPDATLAFGRTICIDTDGNEIPGDDHNETQSILEDEPHIRFHRAIVESGTCFPIFGLFRMDLLRKSTLHRSYYGSDRALIAETALLGKCLLVDEAIFYNREHSDRSIRIEDLAERRRWQDTSASRGAVMEHVNLLRHLFEIARRHPDVVRRDRAVAQVMKVALKRKQLGRIALDFIRYASPKTAAALRQRLVATPNH
jgi:glycosyltransferase involved in cell wall biosynthesis